LLNNSGDWFRGGGAVLSRLVFGPGVHRGHAVVRSMCYRVASKRLASLIAGNRYNWNVCGAYSLQSYLKRHQQKSNSDLSSGIQPVKQPHPTALLKAHLKAKRLTRCWALKSRQTALRSSAHLGMRSSKR
jgi:hypothetical protein